MRLFLIQSTCETNPPGEYSSFFCSVCSKSVPLGHFELAYVVLRGVAKNYTSLKSYTFLLRTEKSLTCVSFLRKKST